MNLLILGGTIFVGRHCVEAALERGHSVTVFHRGSKGTNLIPGAEEILGDRNTDLGLLEGKSWDAVIDTCGYVPRVVSLSAQALQKAVGRYLFVSSISVYEPDEHGVLREPDPSKSPDTEEVTGETYGPLKAACEAVVEAIYGDRALIIRPGLIAGPYDPTNRFTYWVDRLSSGEEALVPEGGDQPMQLIDARDLGHFMVECLEKSLSGRFDAVGEQSSFGKLAETCHQLNPATQIVWAPQEFLVKNEVSYWQDLPLATPPDDENPLLQIDPSPAQAAGLRFRSLQATAQDTLAWFNEVGRPESPRYGMPREKELSLIEQLKA